MNRSHEFAKAVIDSQSQDKFHTIIPCTPPLLVASACHSRCNPFAVSHAFDFRKICCCASVCVRHHFTSSNKMSCESSGPDALQVA
mmetsp:Transcript_294/g.858  ORF Transcript_294/g.858 Transcript_294/m.858 type:complete len:86 (+) Transcript_294:55-312(+)